jgi:hypothetical protein
MLIGNIEVPETKVGKPLTNIPKSLFEPFSIQPKKSSGLRNNENANSSGSGTSRKLKSNTAFSSLISSPEPGSVDKKPRASSSQEQSTQDHKPLKKKPKVVKDEPKSEDDDDDNDLASQHSGNEHSEQMTEKFF